MLILDNLKSKEVEGNYQDKAPKLFKAMGVSVI